LPTSLIVLAGCPSDDNPAADATSAASSDTGGSSSAAGSSSGSTGAADSGSTGDAPPPSRWVVTADFTAHTLTLVDYDALAAGERDPAALVRGTIDLSAWAPGPLEVEIAPDGHTALVSVSPGFFDGIVGQTLGLTDLPLDGAGLVVDLDTREVVTELATAHVPMGFAFLPDGSRAYSANFGYTGARGSTLSILDPSDWSVIEDIEVGEGPEQVAIDDSGTLGILNVDSLGAVRVFETVDPAGTLSAPLEVAVDPSGVAFVWGMPLAVVANSLTPSNWAVIDVSDPAAPVVRDESSPPGGFPYGVSPIPGTAQVLMTLANDDTSFVLIDAGADPSAALWTASAPGLRSFPLGAAIDTASNLALSGAVGADALLAIHLDGSAIETIAWTTPGPSYVAIGPPRT
jgi:YVTN family beta-propeller protein